MRTYNSNIKTLIQEKKKCYQQFLTNHDEKLFIQSMIEIESKIAIIDIQRFFLRIDDHLKYNKSLGFKVEVIERNYNCVLVLLDENRDVIEPESNVNFVSTLTNQAFVQSLVPFDFIHDILNIKFSLSKESYPVLKERILKRLQLNVKDFQTIKFEKDLSIRYSDDHFEDT